MRKKTIKPPQQVRKTKGLHFAKPNEILGGLPYYTNNSKKKLTDNGNLIQEKTTTTMEGSREKEYRNIRQDDKEISLICSIEKLNKPSPDHSGGADVTCTAGHHRNLQAYRRIRGLRQRDLALFTNRL